MSFKLFPLKVLLLLILTNIMSSSADASPNGKLVVELDGLHEQRGQVCLSLFSSGQGFPSQGNKAQRAECFKVADLPMTVSFENLPPGNYAIAAFQDLNSDGILNRNVLGIPTERFGFSQNPRIFSGPPTFGESAVIVRDAQTKIQIRLQNLFGS
jgi:uncharacterized protein (DUF2141 family)